MIDEDQILALYRATFPISERRPDAGVLSSMRSPTYQTFTASAGELLSAFALVYAPPNESFALLEYFAVDPAHREIGVGSRLFHDVVAAFPDRHLIVEVEAQSLGTDAVRRQRFYERLGCERISGLTYLLPLPNAPPMELMIRPTDASPLKLEHCIRQIYETVYGCSSRDPRIDQMLELPR